MTTINGRCVRCGSKVTMEETEMKDNIEEKYWVFPCQCRDEEYDTLLQHLVKHWKRFVWKAKRGHWTK